MESFSKILNLIDIPTSIYKDVLWLYQHCTNNDTEICNLDCSVGEETKTALINNLIKHPHESSFVIQTIQNAFKNKHSSSIDDIISSAITKYLEQYSQDSQNEIDSTAIYSLLSLLEICDDNDNFLSYIFTEIYDLIEKGKLNKDLIYLTLLPQKKLEILMKLLKFERIHFDKCDINDSLSLFRYCLYKNRHWLFHMIENELDSSSISYNITEKLMLLKIIYYTNEIPINFLETESMLSKLPRNLCFDTFIKFYIHEIKWSLELYRYLSDKNIADKNAFELANSNPCLVTLSYYIDLKNIEMYEEINEILIKYEGYLTEMQKIKFGNSNIVNLTHNTEVGLYNAFCLLLAFKYYIKENKNTSVQGRVLELLKKIKHQLLQTNNLGFLLEVFENVFVLLFLQAKHTNNDNKNLTFLCERKEIQFIATFLKTSLKELKLKYFGGALEKNSKSYARINTLINYVNDALWRLELLKSQNAIEENDRNVVNHMLSSPNTLIYLCLENDNFDRAHDVVQTYNLQDTHFAQEIEFMERMQYLKADKNKYSTEIIKFCQETKIADDDEFQETLNKYKENDTVKYLNTNNVFMNIMDVALTFGDNYKISKQLFEAALECKPTIETNTCDYLRFCNNILQVFNAIGSKENISTSCIINSALYPLDINKLRLNESRLIDLKQSYEQFVLESQDGTSDTFNQEHSSNLTYLKLTELCNSIEGPDQLANINYLERLYNYLILFSQILFIRNNNSDILTEGYCNIFNLLHINTAELVGKLLSERNVMPKDLEPLFTRLKLDLVYQIAWNCLPEIDLQMKHQFIPQQLNLTTDATTFNTYLKDLKTVYFEVESSQLKLLTPDIFLLSYIRKRHWLLAYLINKVYLIEEAKPDTNSDRTKYFNHLLNLPSTQYLKLLFNNNNAATVLYHEIPVHKLLLFLDKMINTDDENIDWKTILDLIDSFPEKLLRNDTNLIHLKDLALYNFVCTSTSTRMSKYVEYISHDNLRVKCILENLSKWSGQLCIEILNSELTRKRLHSDQKVELHKWFYQIELYENMRCTFNVDSWNELYTRSKNDPSSVFRLLLTSKQISLLLKWIDINKPQSLDLLNLIPVNYFILILEEGVDLTQVKILLDLLEFDQRIQICRNLLLQIRKLEYLEFIINYLISLLPELESEYKNVMLSLKMISCFNPSEHEYMFCLINKPLLIIEQLIMNTRLEKLSVVLQKIRPFLSQSEDRNIEFDVSIESIDNLFRIYAKKSLDFRGIQPTAGLRTIELKLMQSLDTVSDESDRKSFVMPEKVPDKSDWIQNDEAVECMCCHEVTFSMFNRRHHCRRCGRVICGNCSHKRMEIPEYGSIPVRICNDCYKQSLPEDQSSSLRSEQSSSKSGSLNSWLLTDDEKHNDIVREEFSYEYAPSVSLCLSILKSHSSSVEYSKFLLEQCKDLLPYLQDAISEIDFSFVIQMIKSLVTVAKISSLHNSYKPELSQCNDILLHIELLSLLVEKDCLELFRSTKESLTSDYYLKSGVLRRLRDKLLEQEHWPLALEVSTKAGLDKTGVFAAWGKSCLKAGCLQTAREKFQFCLEKNTVHDTSLDFSMSYDCDDSRSRSHLRSVNLSTVSENRPSKTPAIVNEIISVLETSGRIDDRSVFKTFEIVNLNSSTVSLNTNSGKPSHDPAISVLNKLKNLKSIISGSCSDISQPNRSRKSSRVSIDKHIPKRSYIDPCFYDECLYYLMKYGSHSGILQFYIRHEEIDEALNYVLENRIQTDIFIDIYMKCLEDGKIEVFQDRMQKIDCSLNAWEVYLKSICRYLETNSMFNVLYQLQQFMCDYVRAAMTCIRFYQENTNSFRELLDREEHLHRAQDHLKQELEQEQWVQVTPARKISISSASSLQSRVSNQPSLIMKIDPRNIDKYINTIWRQIEVAKFLAECEIEGRPTLEILNEIFTFSEEEKPNVSKFVPTLFDTQLDKTKLAVLAVVCGKNVEEGFGIAFRIIQDHNLKYLKIYCLAGKYLAQILREDAVVDLVSCIRSSGLNMEAVCKTCDEVLMVSVCALTKANGTGLQLDNLIKLITDVGIKVNAYIESKQLKRAYLLAVRHNRNNDIKKILREADRQNQPQIKAICMKRLNQMQ